MEKHIKKIFGPEYNGIDFSAAHHIMLRDDDWVTEHPMDENYFEAWHRQEGVWQILTYGDYIYLVEGAEKALVIDTGFGVGNLKKMCETLTDKPIIGCFITHEHFDHTGGCSYFPVSYMSQICANAVKRGNMHGNPDHDLFKGVEFPLDFEISVLNEGDEIDLGGGCVLKAYSIPDHAAGSMCLVDLYHRCIFSGDELGTPAYKAIGTSVEQYAKNIDKLFPYFEDVDMLYGGGFVYDHMLLFRQKQCLDMILKGFPGVPYNPPRKLQPLPDPGYVWDGRRLHDQVMFTNMLSREADKKDQFTYGYCTMTYYRDRIFDKKES